MVATNSTNLMGFLYFEWFKNSLFDSLDDKSRP
jgi:hypothetical protein